MADVKALDKIQVELNMKKIIILILLITSACDNSTKSNKAETVTPKEQFSLKENTNPDEILNEQAQKVNDNYQAFIENKNDTTNINRKELYKIFKYDDFSEREGYYQIPYYGCPYKGNKLGNANVILIPKTKRFDTYAITSKCNDNEPCWEKVRQEISSLSIEEINKHFNAVIFIIDKKYLEYTPDLETSYNPKYPYKEDAYVLENGKWSIRKTYTITSENEQEINGLQERYINSLVEKYRFWE